MMRRSFRTRKIHSALSQGSTLGWHAVTPSGLRFGRMNYEGGGWHGAPVVSGWTTKNKEPLTASLSDFDSDLDENRHPPPPSPEWPFSC